MSIWWRHERILLRYLILVWLRKEGWVDEGARWYVRDWTLRVRVLILVIRLIIRWGLVIVAVMRRWTLHSRIPGVLLCVGIGVRGLILIL